MILKTKTMVRLLVLIGSILVTIPSFATTIFSAGFDSAINEFDVDGNLLNSHNVGFNAGTMDYNPLNDTLFFGFYSGPSALRGIWSMDGDGSNLTRIFNASSINRSLTIDYVNGFVFSDFDGSEGLV
ncbi:hypothetical protein [Glaciecola sp. MF2-115]|uniref:hypothetical protein n=1 Tax=Glaciecola sp. MF2-115 TaxID=3384827 RepID=UPI0039A2D4B8